MRLPSWPHSHFIDVKKKLINLMSFYIFFALPIVLAMAKILCFFLTDFIFLLLPASKILSSHFSMRNISTTKQHTRMCFCPPTEKKRLFQNAEKDCFLWNEKKQFFIDVTPGVLYFPGQKNIKNKRCWGSKTI